MGGVSYERDRRGGASDERGGVSFEWVDAPVGGAPVGGVSYKCDRRVGARDERGGVSFERDRGRIPIVVDGRGVRQTMSRQLMSLGGQLRISEVSFERDQRVVVGGRDDVPQTDVSFERDRGRIPIVVDGRGVRQTMSWQLMSLGGQLRISEVSFERDQRVVVGGRDDVPQTDVGLERDRRVVVGGHDDVPQTDASCRVVGGRRGDVPRMDPRYDCGNVRSEPDRRVVVGRCGDVAQADASRESGGSVSFEHERRVVMGGGGDLPQMCGNCG